MRDNPEGMSFDSARPVSGSNPSIDNAFGNLEFENGGKRYRIPLVNIGLEVKF